MSATLKTLTGAALAAAMTLGGLTSAYAQNEEQPLYDENVIEEVQTETGQPMPVTLKNGHWIYEDHTINTGHEWVGMAGGELKIAGLYHNFWDIYHKGGSINVAESWDVDIDRLWVTLDTLNASRNGYCIDVDYFILQIGTRDVYGETFGVKVADKKLVLSASSMSYDGKPANMWGVDYTQETCIEIDNYPDGVIHDVELSPNAQLSDGRIINFGIIYKAKMGSGSIDNYCTIDECEVSYGTITNHGIIGNIAMSGGILNNCHQVDMLTVSDEGSVTNASLIDETVMSSGTFLNQGQVGTFTMSGGTLDNIGYIETLYYSGGTITSSGENIGEIVYVDAAADAGTIDEGYVDEGVVAAPIIILDNADWQDAALLGEEVMGW